MNKRRRLIVALGAGGLAAPFGAFAQQQGKVWRVGFLSLRSRPASLDPDTFGAFSDGMRELGYVEGKNLVIESRFADSRFEHLPGLAEELVKIKVDVIVTAGTQATREGQKATTTIPIVMGTAGDPVGSGFVKSLAHPGGNITGLSELAVDISPKHLEMLLGMVPKLSRVAVLMNPHNSSHAMRLTSAQAAARKSGVRILPVEAHTQQQIESAFSLITKERAGAVIVTQDPLFTQQRRQIAELAVKNRLPTISSSRQYAEAGCLMTYGPNSSDQFRRAAIYVDKILKGATPGDLPVEQPTKFEMIINGKTAKALSIKIPQSLLISVDKVIE